MQKDVVLRMAQPQDMEAVLELIKELAIYENAGDQVSNTTENLIKDGFGQNKVFDCVLAILDGDIVGFALWYTSYSTWKGKCLYLEDLLVTNDQRRKGIGKLLFDFVHQKANELNVARFQWQVLDWNTPAINFYKKYEAVLDDTWINCKLVLAS